MIANLLLGILAVLLCLFSNNKEKGLKWAFFYITLFLSVRYDWGNDYMPYLKLFQEYGNFNYDIYLNVSRESREYGWVILNCIFGMFGFGFFGMVIALSIFENWAVYRMIKKYVAPHYYWVAVFFYVLSSFFCVSASMFRQYLCICLYLFVVDIMIEKKLRYYLLWSIAIIVIGTFFHKSFIIMLASLPFFYIHVKPKRSSWLFMAIIAVIFVVWSLIGRNYLEPLLLNLLEENEDYSSYLYYLDKKTTGGLVTGLGVFFRYLMFCIWLLLLPYMEKNQQSILLLCIVSYFFEIVADIIPMAGRLQMYFSFLYILFWSWLLMFSKKQPILYGLFGIQTLITIKTFFEFFSNPNWVVKCYNFHTIFETESWM